MALGTEIALIKALGGAALPPITAADNGKVLTADSGAWGAQEPIGKKFVVTLTPTAADYSGTMDKTAEEITAAYGAGAEIWFSFSGGSSSYLVPCDMIADTGDPNLRFYAHIVISDLNIVIEITTPTGSDMEAEYYTVIYTLTPAT